MLAKKRQFWYNFPNNKAFVVEFFLLEFCQKKREAEASLFLKLCNFSYFRIFHPVTLRVADRYFTSVVCGAVLNMGGIRIDATAIPAGSIEQLDGIYSRILTGNDINLEFFLHVFKRKILNGPAASGVVAFAPH